MHPRFSRFLDTMDKGVFRLHCKTCLINQTGTICVNLFNLYKLYLGEECDLVVMFQMDILQNSPLCIT